MLIQKHSVSVNAVVFERYSTPDISSINFNKLNPYNGTCSTECTARSDAAVLLRRCAGSGHFNPLATTKPACFAFPELWRHIQQSLLTEPRSDDGQGQLRQTSHSPCPRSSDATRKLFPLNGNYSQHNNCLTQDRSFVRKLLIDVLERARLSAKHVAASYPPHVASNTNSRNSM